MTPKEILSFLHKAGRLKENTRHSQRANGRKESVAEHSWRLSLFAMLLETEIEGVDFNRIIRMCILHDLGEAITGDIPSFEKTEKDDQKEETAVMALLDTLPEPVSGIWKAIFEEMATLETKEAKIYKALDKMEAVLQHNEDPISTWLPLEYELNPIYGEEEAKVHPVLTALRQELAQNTAEKIKKKGNIYEL